MYVLYVFFFYTYTYNHKLIVKLKRGSCVAFNTRKTEIKDIFINLYIFLLYQQFSTFLIHAYMCTLAIIRTFIVTLLKITNLRS